MEGRGSGSGRSRAGGGGSVGSEDLRTKITYPSSLSDSEREAFRRDLESSGMTAEQQARYSYNEFQMDNLQREMVQRINNGGASDNYMQRVTDEVNRLRRQNNRLRYGR